MDVSLGTMHETPCAIKVSLVPHDTTLLPLPIMGMFYRWFVDLAGPFPQSFFGTYYVMVMIEYLNKLVEVADIPSKESSGGAHVF